MFCVVKLTDREGRGHGSLFSIHIQLLLGEKFGHWGHSDSLRGSCPPIYKLIRGPGKPTITYFTLLSSLPTIFCIKGIAKEVSLCSNIAHVEKKRLMWVGVGVGVGIDLS